MEFRNMQEKWENRGEKVGLGEKKKSDDVWANLAVNFAQTFSIENSNINFFRQGIRSRPFKRGGPFQSTLWKYMYIFFKMCCCRYCTCTVITYGFVFFQLTFSENSALYAGNWQILHFFLTRWKTQQDFTF